MVSGRNTHIDQALEQRLQKHALSAVAKLTHVDLHEAVAVQRTSPLLNEEIPLEEELINLEEAVKTYRLAMPNFQRYPKMRTHLHQEKRLILKHCLGLMMRLLMKRPMHGAASSSDAGRAISRLVQIIVEDIRRNGIRLDTETKRIFEPFLDLKLRLMLSERPWSRFIGYQAKYSPVRVLIDHYS
ncbi:MAG TPA: hypothetical protein VFH39_02655 [Candidatus Saccharimonadales bacterium]|nr:hypothetical protein [Candidatus Saccharimonadales bacterium]